MKTTYSPGKWLAVCDICGFRFYNDQLRKNWQNLMVCEHDFETRHPQDLLRVPREDSSVDWTRPESDIFIPINLTSNINELLPLIEAVGLNLQKIIVPVYSSTGAINGWVINGSAINANSLTNSASSEAISFIETLTFSNIKTFNEAISIVETIVLMLLSGTAINGMAINSTSIG